MATSAPEALLHENKKKHEQQNVTLGGIEPGSSTFQV